MPLQKIAPPSPEAADPTSRSKATLDRRVSNRGTVPSLARDAIEDLVGLVGSQIELAKAEISSDLKASTRAASGILVFVPVLTIGYCLVLAAGVHQLAGLIGWTASLLSLGALHLVVALVGMRRAKQRLAAVQFLDRTGAQLDANVAQIARDVRPALGAADNS